MSAANAIFTKSAEHVYFCCEEGPSQITVWINKGRVR